MKKETLIAIILGVAAGIGIALFIISTSQRSLKKNSDVLLTQVSPTVKIDNDVLSPLLIDKPENASVTSENKITIKGTGQKGSLVVIQGLKGEKIMKTDSTNFSGEVALAPGENHIRITSYFGKNIDTRSLVVYMIQDEK